MLQSTTNSCYVITNVQFSDAGSYSVVVSNGYGSVINSNITVSVYESAPYIILERSSAPMAFSLGQFNFDVSGNDGDTIVVDATTNLFNWVPVFTNTLGAPPYHLTDITSSNAPSRFYRVRKL